MTVFEVRRGLLFRGAEAKLASFNRLIATAEIVPIDDTIFALAAQIWADGRRLGKAHNDADVLIAATAIALGRTLVSGNTQHFEWIESLRLINWREA